MTNEGFQPNEELSWERKAREERANLQKQLESLKGEKVVSFDFNKDGFDFLITFEGGASVSFMGYDPVSYPIHEWLEVHASAEDRGE